MRVESLELCDGSVDDLAQIVFGRPLVLVRPVLTVESVFKTLFQRRGRLSRLDVCDAHPELMRAARNVGETTVHDCPICEDARLVHVSYVFGPRLPPGGQCISSARELARLSRRADKLTCYVVEVCPECSWNHLARALPIGNGTRRP